MAVVVPLLKDDEPPSEQKSVRRDPRAGWRRVVVFCSLANLVNSADRVIMPVTLHGISADYGYDLMQQGWIYSAFPAGYIISQLLGTCLSVQVVPRRVLFVVVLLWSFCTLITPFFAPSFQLLMLTRVFLGLAEGMGLPVMYSIVSEVCGSSHRATGLSYLHSAGSLGQMIATMFSPHFSWSSPFYALGGFGLVWSVAWMRSTRGVLTEEVTPLHNKTKSVMTRKWSHFFCLSPLLAIYFAHFCMNWTSYVVMNWLPTYLRVTFHADPHAISLVALPYLANSLAGIVVGHVLDACVSSRRLTLRGARVAATAFGLALPALFLLFFAFVRNLYVAIFFISLSMACLSFNSGGHLSNHGDVSTKYAAVTFAISNTIATLPGLFVGPFTAHLVIDSTGRWWPSFVLASVLNFVGTVVYAGYARTDKLL